MMRSTETPQDADADRQEAKMPDMSGAGLQSDKEVEKFDRVAEDYSELHEKSVSASGESAEYFARYKVERLRRLGLGKETKVLDYGCGIGSLSRLLTEEYGEVHGYDPSQGSIERARNLGGDVRYFSDRGQLAAAYDLVVAAGVLHHIPVEERSRVAEDMREKLAPGGRLVVFEHNPWNPLTRRAVDACPFDDDAVLLPPGEIEDLLKGASLKDIKQDFIVFFPRFLSWLRPLEPSLGFVPLGAQTMTVGRC